MVLFLKGTQIFNNLFKIRLVQSIINPYFILVALVISLLVTYKRFVILVLSSNGGDLPSLSLNGDAIVDLTDDYVEFGSNVTDLTKNLLDYKANVTIERLEEFQMNAIGDFELRNDDYTSFNDELVLLLSSYDTLLSNLNATITDQLSAQQSVIQGYKDKLSDSLFVGGSVDITGLYLNISDISNSLADAVNKKFITSQYTINDTVVDDIKELFNSSIAQVKNYQSFNATSLSGELLFNLSPQLISSIRNSTNGTVATNHKVFTKKMNKTLWIIGVSVIVIYFMMLVYQYFKFQFEVNLRLQKFIEIKKQTEFDEHDQVNYVDLIQDMHDVKALVFTDMARTLFNFNDTTRDKVHWLGSYLFGVGSNLPFLGMVLVLLVILKMSIASVEVDDVSSGSIFNEYGLFNETTFDSYREIDLSDLLKRQQDYYSEITDQLSESLIEIYSTNNMTLNHSITLIELSVDMPSIGPLLSSLKESLSPMSITEEIQITQDNSVSPAKKILKDLSKSIQGPLKISLITVGSVFFLLVLVGFVYAIFI